MYIDEDILSYFTPADYVLWFDAYYLFHKKRLPDDPEALDSVNLVIHCDLTST